jgi:hypothetical protein
MRNTGRSLRLTAPAGHRHGQAVTELALILPVLMLIVLLVLDFGHLFLGWVNLQNTARIGADYAATHPKAWSASPDPDAQARYEELIRRDATTINCVLPSAIPTPAFPDGTSTLNGRAQVKLTCNFAILTPIISQVIGSPLGLGASADFPIRAGLANVAPPPPPPPPSPTPTPTPTPTPDPSASASPTPTPTPVPCIVPTLLGNVPNKPLADEWADAGFTIPYNVTVGTKKIGSEYYLDGGGGKVGGPFDGSILECDVELTVGP